MAINSEHLEAARAALRSMPKKRKKNLTNADFVTALIKDINAQRAAGYSLEDICEELNKGLPDGSKLNMNTFRTFVGKANRESAQVSTQRKQKAPAAQVSHPQSETKSSLQTKPTSDFRFQGGDL